MIIVQIHAAVNTCQMIYDVLVVMFVVALDKNTPKTRCGGNILIVRGRYADKNFNTYIEIAQPAVEKTLNLVNIILICVFLHQT